MTIILAILSISFAGIAIYLYNQLKQKQQLINTFNQQHKDEHNTIAELKEHNEVLQMELSFVKKVYRTRLLDAANKSQSNLRKEEKAA
jgi:ABC-type thiamine transport system substrate-binding protein